MLKSVYSPCVSLVSDSCTKLSSSCVCDPHSVVPQYIEDVAQQDQRASGEPVQILGIGHLQGFPEEASVTQELVDLFTPVQDELSDV